MTHTDPQTSRRIARARRSCWCMCVYVYVCLGVRVCQDSLGGESKALMLVCASPCVTDASETACSLNFASRVRNVELGPAKRKGGTDIITEMKMKVCQYVYMSFRVC